MPMLSLFKSPLRASPAEKHELLSHGSHSSDEEQVAQDKQIAHTQTSASELPLENNDEQLHDSPAFHHHAEATTIELFYDLFFVANLTTFTSGHDINSRDALASYVGFVSVLWFTWYQVSLYDVRFAVDSVFDRICKALQFGVMVGFAVIGPEYDPSASGYWVKNFRAMSILLMVSRIVLCFQYGATLWFTKRYTKTRLPLALIIGSTLLAAVIYAAIIPAFPDELAKGQESHTYIAFYVVAVGETLVTTIVSSVLRVVSFKGTHFVQRMSLLTLIILGEGIILLTKAISNIVKNAYAFTSDTIGQIISAVLIIYFLYMLYFDRCETERHFGTIRQQVWSFLHFPLHIAFVLAVEGVSQNIVWHQAFQSVNGFATWLQAVADQYFADPTQTQEDLVSTLTSMADEFLSYVPKGVDVTESANAVYDALATLGSTTDSDSTLENAITDYTFSMVNILLESLKLDAPKAKDGSKKTPAETLDAISDVFNLISVYFFVAAGCSVILMEALSFLSMPPKTITAWLRTGINVAIGIGLCLLSIMESTNVGQERYLPSGWVLPTLCLSLLLAIFVVHLRHFRK